MLSDNFLYLFLHELALAAIFSHTSKPQSKIMLTRKNGKQLSPCIIAKVKHALNLVDKKPINKKTCSEEYWHNTVIIVAEKYHVKSKSQIEKAKQSMKLYK